MATATQALPQKGSLYLWFPSFLCDELRFYPGRMGKIARITISCVLTLIVVETFRIPSEVYAVIAVFIIAKYTPGDLIHSTVLSAVATTVGVSLILVEAAIFADSQFIHFFYLIGGFFVLFFLARTLVNPAIATSLMIGFFRANIAWENAASPDAQVRGALWVLLGIAIGLVIACLVELASVRQDPVEQLLKDIDERIHAASELFLNLSDDPDESAKGIISEKLASLAVVGTGRLRQEMRLLTNNQFRDSTYYAKLSAAIALAGQLVNVAASLGTVTLKPSNEDCCRFRTLSEDCERIRLSLIRGESLDAASLQYTRKYSVAVPALPVLERTVQLFFLVVQDVANSGVVEVGSPDGQPKSTKILVNDLWSNPDHLRFAVKGTLAAMICYVIYSSVDWPGIATSVVTCFITALSTVGASKQKLFGRLAGAFVGGALGIASLIFLLPSIYSIAGFSLLIAAGTAFCAWFATASPRISYFGLQMAVGFFLTLLQGFEEGTSLVAPRDRLVGVLLSGVVMGVVFDRLWPISATREMLRELVGALRNMGMLCALLAEEDSGLSEAKIALLKESISAELANAHTHADSIKFEFGAGRERNLALRENALRWKSLARTLYLVELSLGSYIRQQNAQSRLPPPLRLAMDHFCLTAADILRVLADHIEGRKPTIAPDLQAALVRVEKEISEWCNLHPNENRSTITSAILAIGRQFITVSEALDADIRANTGPRG